jgi:hypothetical protein
MKVAILSLERHCDRALAFVFSLSKTEIEVGKALNSATCPVPRREIFLTTKHWRAFHGYEETKQCLDLSLKRLGVDYVDLYLIHWPGPAYHTMGRSKATIEASPLGAFVYARKVLLIPMFPITFPDVNNLSPQLFVRAFVPGSRARKHEGVTS